jgi:hypothetical protein
MSVALSSEDRRAEAERQLSAALDRHREAVTSMEQLGRSAAGQHVAVKSVGRAVHLVSFALRQAAEAHVPLERLVELTGWDPELVREGLERMPAPQYIARLAPAGVDTAAVAEAAAAFEAISRLQSLTQRVLADIDGEPAEPGDLDDLHDRLETTWRSWRDGLGRRDVEGRSA